MIPVRILGLVLAAPATDALAQAAVPAGGGSVGPGLLQATAGLALVLALIWGAAWVVRRLGPVKGAASSVIRIVAAQNVGPRERVVVVEIGEQWLVLGVASGGVNTLQTLPKASLPPSLPPANPFGRLLAKAKGALDA